MSICFLFVKEQICDQCAIFYCFRYIQHCAANRCYGARFFGNMLASRSFFDKAVVAWSNLFFQQVWSQIIASPVMVLCTDEADCDQGIRAQIIQYVDGRAVPSSCWIQLRQLADFSAKGIWNSLKACFASPCCRPEELKHLVISEQQFARKCVGLVADGATVNGLQQQDTEGGTRIKVPIEYSKEGDNVFHYFSEFRKDFSEVKPIGADIRQSLFFI